MQINESLFNAKDLMEGWHLDVYSWNSVSKCHEPTFRMMPKSALIVDQVGSKDFKTGTAYFRTNFKIFIVNFIT